MRWSNQPDAGWYGMASVAILLAWSWPSSDRRSTLPQGSQEWHLVEQWPALAPGVRLGQVSGVDIDTSGHVMVFHRAGGTFDRAATQVRPTATVFELDPASGALINSWGADRFVLPHSLTVDRSNNVWLTDDVLQQVMKFSHDGQLLLTVGTPRKAGWDSTHFNEPTDVAVAADSSFYVSDGYQNSRVAHFDAKGRFLNEWGTKGSSRSQFQIPHGIVIGADGNVYVSDRENRRVQVFSKSGAPQASWPTSDSAGRVFDVAISSRGYIYVAMRNSTTKAEIRILDRNWRDVGSIRADTSVFVVPHQIAVQGDTALYIADTNGQRILKYVRR